MSSKYQFHDREGVYFVTFTVVYWIDIFTRNEYRQVFTASLDYCREHKNLNVHAWVLMTNHAHLIISTNNSTRLSDIVRDMKSYISRQIRTLLEEHSRESRKEWLLHKFSFAGKGNSNNHDFQLWIQGSHPVLLNTWEKYRQRLLYLHYNPVRAGFVAEPEHWVWSSAIDYNGGKGLIPVVFLE